CCSWQHNTGGKCSNFRQENLGIGINGTKINNLLKFKHVIMVLEISIATNSYGNPAKRILVSIA
ncbi:MAG: hypothetical protein RR861_07390, partial [Glutamicibacter sp.]